MDVFAEIVLHLGFGFHQLLLTRCVQLETQLKIKTLGLF